MHMHGFSFQVVERRNSPAMRSMLTGVRSPIVGGRMRNRLAWRARQIAIDFTHPYRELGLPGPYHNLEH